jgi:xylulokinase
MAGTPVIAGTTDTVAEMLGSGAVAPGSAVIKLASVGRIAVVTENPVRHPHILNYRHIFAGLWYPGTASKYAASAYRWLRDAIWTNSTGDDAAYRSMDEDAWRISAGCDGLIFHPHLMGEWAPYWDEEMRGNFIGLTTRHTRAHLTRAVLEGVAFALKDALAQMESRGVKAHDIRLIGQGSKSSFWAQIVADIIDRPLRVPAEPDAAYGAALITAMGVRLIERTPNALESAIAIHRTIEPNAERVRQYATLFQIYRDADRALRPLAARLHAFEHQQGHRENDSTLPTPDD